MTYRPHFSDIKNINYAKPDVLWRVKSYTRKELLDGVRESEKVDFVKYCDFTDRFTIAVNQEKRPSSETPFGGLTAKVFSTTKCDKSKMVLPTNA